MPRALRPSFRRSGIVVALALAGCGGENGAPGIDPRDGGSGGSDGPADNGVTFMEVGVDSAPDTAPIDTAPETPIDTALAAPICVGEEPEPNDTEPSAVPLGAIDACDSSGSAFSGYLHASTDVDHWHYQGREKLGCRVDPTATTKDDVELCVFVACLSGATQINDCTSGSPASSYAKLSGCCTSGPGTAIVDFKCTLLGGSDEADVYLRVRNPKAKACQPYDVSYHY